MSETEQKRLTAAGLLFHEPDSAMLLASGLGKNWPEARGVFATGDGRFSAWINEEDHLMLIARSATGDIREAFRCLASADGSVRKHLEQQGHPVAQSPRLGFLTTCPSNVGTALTAEVTVRLPSLSKHQDYRKLCKRLKLVTRNAITPDLNAEPLTVVSNLERLGSSEVDQVSTVIKGVRALVKAEVCMQRGDAVDLSSIEAAV